ncbi:MAG: VOC family protein [candidate division Zixibacteria bacterium]|nr:VOC family protein [candidate division Zixibacteria bacterium]NIS45641.1 VOC family protein [candidate division Zixibacteria bacterium]NIU12687.1 VOC family protein [candidate division Zixibacteria bacterium]NIV05807.1 VOC family protein [candidate division Zixibacteria bacterium]NIW43469.1 VOC family protein [Gammaproteobacteria bacterium]
MNTKFKPENYNSISPYIITGDASEIINFLVEVFDAQELRRFPGEDGHLMHAEVRIDDSVLMLADSTDDWQPIPGYVHIYVPDVDATYQKALDHGGESVQKPKQHDGEDDRRGGFRDAMGNTWWIATKVK